MKYWYLITHFECPPCGHETVCRERVYAKPANTHVFVADYDWCLE